MTHARYRVAQWGTGHTGMHSLRKVIEHPRFDLVGVRVYASAKVGRDAGELCGTEPTGVIATSEIDDIIAVAPDCVLYMPLVDGESIDDVCRLLESGINVTTTIGNFYYPAALDPAERQRIEDACQQGGTSLYGTGPSPGFISDVLPMTLALMERRLDRLSIVQWADLSERKSPELLGALFGSDPATASLDELTIRRTKAGESLRQLADTMGVPLDDVTITATSAVALKTTEIDVMTIEAGTVGAWRVDVTGHRDGKPLLEFQRNMYVVAELDPAWEMRDGGWRIVVAGDAPMDIDIRFPTEGYGPRSAGYNAHIAVNAVSATCEARPGILTTGDVRLIPTFG